MDHYVRGPDDGPEAAMPPTRTRHRLWHWFTHLLDDRKPGQFSSIAPRRSDGTRTKIFFFNGNGRSR